jgi:3D (Asp-Asp-Asp) domain-containing protein
MGIKKKLLIAMLAIALSGAPLDAAPEYLPRRSPVKYPIKAKDKIHMIHNKMSVSAYSVRKTKSKKHQRLTATQTPPIVGLTVAISRDKKHLLGRTVWIDGVGTREITDLMGRQWTNKMDVLVATRKDAKAFGLKKKVRVILL